MLSKEYLESKRVPELKSIAKKLGITNYSKLKKAEMITVILKHPINKKGILVAKKKVVEVPKKKKSAPTKKKSPGMPTKVKEYFSEPKKKATKRKSVKKVKIPSELRNLKEEAKENANLSQTELRKKYASPKKSSPKKPRAVKSSSGIFGGIPAFKSLLKNAKQQIADIDLKKFVKLSPKKVNFRG